MSDPLPGREFDFNDGYQNMHMGDLVQLPGWTGAQRFRLVPDVMPRNIQPLYRRGNLIVWTRKAPISTSCEATPTPPSREARAGSFLDSTTDLTARSARPIRSSGRA